MITFLGNVSWAWKREYILMLFTTLLDLKNEERDLRRTFLWFSLIEKVLREEGRHYISILANLKRRNWFVCYLFCLSCPIWSCPSPRTLQSSCTPTLRLQCAGTGRRCTCPARPRPSWTWRRRCRCPGYLRAHSVQPGTTDFNTECCMIVIFDSFFIFKIYIKYEMFGNGSIQSGEKILKSWPKTIFWNVARQTERLRQTQTFQRLIKIILTSLFVFEDFPTLEA